jgi:ABC-type sugar transport system ATPase subunit
MSAILELRGISKRFAGVAALTDAGMTVEAGEAHALMGANGAGKSTLMNVLGGVVPKDEGEILIDGRPVEITGPRDARRNGIAFVHQELNMLPSMTVAENVLIDELPTSGGFVDRKAMRERVSAILQRLGCAFGPDDVVETLGMGDRQMVEVARALAGKPRIVIFDEPTSSLSEREKRRLFDVIGRLKANGTAVIYITHFMDEIFEVCERVTVMRNGQRVGSGLLKDYRPGEIVALMLGDVHEQDRLRAPQVLNTPSMLEVEGLHNGALAGVGLTLRPGEIVGLWGLLGSGRTEILRALVGLDPIDRGTIRFGADGRLSPVTPRQLHAEVGFVTEDRRGEGLLLPLPVASNISFGNLDRLLGRLGLIDRKREQAFAQGFADRLRIKLASIRQPVRTLSGGNQQKVVFARWLGTQPKLFLLDEPTRGLDVGAKTEILRLTVELAEAGAAVLLVASELEELMRVCDRYLIVQRGRIAGELPGSADKDMLLHAVSEARPVERQAA